MMFRRLFLGMALTTVLGSNWAEAQFQTFLTNYGRTAPAIRRVGVGLFTVAPTSALEVDGSLLPVGFTTGEVFRTNAPAAANTFWRMYSGSPGAGSERGQLFANTGAPHFNINAPNGHFQLWTNTVERARLNSNVTTAMGPLNEFPGVIRDGFFLLSGQPDAFTNAASRAPFSRLHLVDNIGAVAPLIYAQEHGFRPWQRNGITFTGNSDQGYIGQQFNGADATDIVIHWSDNPDPSPNGTDRLKFIFTTQFNAGAARGAATMSGIEAMRFWPATNLSVNVGVGDFAPPTVGDPTERLDMLDGRLRIRDLPLPANEATGTYKIMVVDDVPLPSTERGVVKWIDQPVDCKWTLLGAPGSNSDIATAYASNPGCPQDDRNVGIGTATIQAKLDVYKQANTNYGNMGLRSLMNGTAPGKTAGFFEASGSGDLHIAVDTRAWGAGEGGRNIGISGWAIEQTAPQSWLNIGVNGVGQLVSGGNVEKNIAVLGETTVSATSTVNFNYGVIGSAINAAASTANYGGYFEANAPSAGANWALYTTGAAYTPLGVWTPSDASLKTGIVDADVLSSADVLNSIQLHEYEFDPAACPQMEFPVGRQLGVMADEFAAVFPNLVRAAVQPPKEDEAGNEIHPAVSFKAVNYEALIPYLVAGYQAQNARIAEQDARLAEMQEQLAACCANPTGDGQRIRVEGTGTAEGADRLLHIQPNPFSEPPTVFYTLERSGRMQLMANSADGKQLRVLHDANMEAGQYQYEWNTTDLSPGMYYVTLLLDGEPIVKKAVKVQR